MCSLYRERTPARQALPPHCVNYDTWRRRESTYLAGVSSLTGTRRKWRVLFEKRRQRPLLASPATAAIDRHMKARKLGAHGRAS
jgi:hypothetical protein